MRTSGVVALLLTSLAACGESSANSDPATPGGSYTITDSAGRVHRGALDLARVFRPNRGSPDTSLRLVEADAYRQVVVGGLSMGFIVLVWGHGLDSPPADLTVPIRLGAYPRAEAFVDSGAVGEWIAESGSVRLRELDNGLLQWDIRARVRDVQDTLRAPNRLRLRLVAEPPVP